MKCGVENQEASKGSRFSKGELLTLFAIIIVMGAFGGNYYLQQKTSPSSSIEPIYNAIVNEDIATFTKSFGLEKEEENTVLALMDYINEQDMDHPRRIR